MNSIKCIKIYYFLYILSNTIKYYHILFTPLEFSNEHFKKYNNILIVHHSIDYKNSAVKYYLKIKNYVEVCKIDSCNRTSLMRWVI